jgi:LmbE family N-acetylglucosaminyl deacetylase
MMRFQIIWAVAFVLAIHNQISTEFVPLTSSLRAVNGPQDLLELESFKDNKTVIVFAHQDDDLLWMLPFWPKAQVFLLSAYPAFAQFQELVLSFPPDLHYAQRWEPIWGFREADEFAMTFTDKCIREKIVYLESIKEHLRPYLKEGVQRVITHNNWGEYGHHQHRLVNQAVRELAVEYKLDVYALGVQVLLQAYDRPEGYENVADRTGLPQPIEGYFDPELFHRIRQAYIDRIPYASTPETTQRLRSWSPTLWTWSRRPLAFPVGWRPFVKLVQAGQDLTVGNEAVRKLTAQPVVNACPEP